MFSLPNIKDVLASLPTPTKSEYKYRTIKLKPGTNIISTKISNDMKTPFTIWISAIQRVSYSKIIKGRMTTVKQYTKAPTLDDLKLGYYNADMSHVNFDPEHNAFVLPGDTVRITFFGSHSTTPPEDGAKEMINIDNDVYVTYLDSVTELSVGTGGGDYEGIAEAIAAAAPGATIKLAKGTYDKPLLIDKSVNFIGEDGACFTEAIEIGQAIETVAEVTDDTPTEPKVVPTVDVSFTNIKFTGNAQIKINTSDDVNTMFTLNGCEIALEPNTTEEKRFGISTPATGRLYANINNCVFFDSNETIYNYIEFHCEMMNGSNFSNNTFKVGCATHNYINLYGLAPDATIHIDNNYAVYSANLMRIGFRGDPAGKVYVIGNKYDSTDTDSEYAGLIVFQPVYKETTSMANLTVYIDKTVHSDKLQVGYFWAKPEGDTEWTNENKPTVYLNGEKYDLTNKMSITEFGDASSDTVTTSTN